MTSYGEKFTSATDRTFATPELFEQILSCLLDDIWPISSQEDPRSVKTHSNAQTLIHLLRCSEVARTWQECMLGSKRLQRALFTVPDDRTGRSWQQASSSVSLNPLRWGNCSSGPTSGAPLINPVIQTLFPHYHFRLMFHSLETSNRHYAYLIISKRALPALHLRSQTGQGRAFSDMLLSQPPCTELEATVWDERDETKDYIGRTSSLREPVFRCEGGLTLGMVHERVGEMFREHPDVTAIKLTTL